MQEKRFILITALTANLSFDRFQPPVNRSALLHELREEIQLCLLPKPKVSRRSQVKSWVKCCLKLFC
jgi:hypothetical protein